MQQLNYRKIRTALLLFAVVCLIIIGFFVYQHFQNPYGKELQVSNLDQYTKGKPINKTTLSYIKHNLYETVNLNRKNPVTSDSIKDIMIRDESFSQTYDTSKHVYNVHFIVDIKSLKQSYNVAYQWVDDLARYGPNMDENGTKVTCLPVSELIYGKFECKDDIILTRGVNNSDPVGKLLPYADLPKYKINDYQRNADFVTLQVDAYAKANELSVSQDDLNEYTTDINTWLTANKLDASHYTINFTY